MAAASCFLFFAMSLRKLHKARVKCTSGFTAAEINASCTLQTSVFLSALPALSIAPVPGRRWALSRRAARAAGAAAPSWPRDQSSARTGRRPRCPAAPPCKWVWEPQGLELYVTI